MVCNPIVPLSFGLWLAALLPAQDPTPPKGPDKEVAAKLETLKDCLQDKKFARDAEALGLVDQLLQKHKDGLDPKDLQAVVKGLDGVLNAGAKLRPPESASLYVAAATALGSFGADGAKVLKATYSGKRFPEKKEWVPLREALLKSLGRTKDESMVKFLTNEAVRNPEPALQGAAGEALGNFEEAKEAVRKEIVGDLLRRWGEEEELASQMGSANIQAQNARDRLAALSDKWNRTLEKLTRQSFRKFLDWQSWHNKNKNQPWP